MIRLASSLLLALALGASTVMPAAEAEDITPGDFVTAECVLERGRLVAVRVTMAEVR